MTALDALLLGLLQGVTELLPVSSSGHLALAESFFRLGIPSDLQSFDILLHLGSLLAILLCFPAVWLRLLRAPFARDGASLRLLSILVVATIPAAAAGLLFQDVIVRETRALPWLAAGFLANGVLLLLVEWRPQERSTVSMRWGEAVLIGIAQAFGLLPSVSRSACTIAAARALKWTRSAAVDFSFLLAVPVIAGAELVAAKDVFTGSAVLPSFPVAGAGVLASFGASVLAILFLRRLVRSVSLKWFALYLIPLGLVLFIV